MTEQTKWRNDMMKKDEEILDLKDKLAKQGTQLNDTTKSLMEKSWRIDIMSDELES